MLVHFHKDGGKVCQGQDCPSALHKVEPQWKAYAPVQQWIHEVQGWRYAVLEVTGNLSEFFTSRKLRGEIWNVERVGPTKKKTKVVGRYLERVGEQSLPLAFDILPVLKRFFSTPVLGTLDAPNPIPPRLLLPDTPGEPPAGLPRPKKQERATPEEITEMRRTLAEAKAKLFQPPPHADR